MHKKFAVMILGFVAAAFFFASPSVKAADEAAEAGGSKGSMTAAQRTTHCNDQADKLALTDDKKDEFVAKCQTPLSQVQRSSAARLQGKM